MRPLDRIIDLLLICAGFLGALWLYNQLFAGGLTFGETMAGSGASILTFWTAIQLKKGTAQRDTSPWVELVERYCLGTGVNLLLHAVLTYAFFLRRTPFLIAVGGLFAAALLGLREGFASKRQLSKRRFVLIGFDSVARGIFEFLKEALVGVVSYEPALVPAGTEWLGKEGDIEAVVGKYRPTNIVVSMPDWAERISPGLLLKFRLAGVLVEESPALYERFLHRVCCERLQPVEVMLSSALRGDSRTIAIQSVYTNLIGLTLLLGLSPVLLLAAAGVALFGGSGPVFESSECAGFQYIPFRLLRFRTTRLDGTETMTAAGRLISRLRLVNLPQLINVVRGDMALVGPKPVRPEFARYLTEVMPFYSHRFSVKPGMLGWAQLHAKRSGWHGQAGLADECLQIEYDLFYVKEGSLWLDAEIMLSSLRLRGGDERAGRD